MNGTLWRDPVNTTQGARKIEQDPLAIRHILRATRGMSSCPRPPPAPVIGARRRNGRRRGCARARIALTVLPRWLRGALLDGLELVFVAILSHCCLSQEWTGVARAAEQARTEGRRARRERNEMRGGDRSQEVLPRRERFISSGDTSTKRAYDKITYNRRRRREESEVEIGGSPRQQERGLRPVSDADLSSEASSRGNGAITRVAIR